MASPLNVKKLYVLSNGSVVIFPPVTHDFPEKQQLTSQNVFPLGYGVTDLLVADTLYCIVLWNTDL